MKTDSRTYKNWIFPKLTTDRQNIKRNDIIRYSFVLYLRTDDTNKKSMPGLIYIFWHIFIAYYTCINNRFLKYQEFVNLLWCSKLYFSPISYICPYKFLSLYLPFLWKIEWKIKICAVKLIHFININRTLVVIFMILEKSLFVSSVLKGWLKYTLPTAYVGNWWQKSKSASLEYNGGCPILSEDKFVFPRTMTSKIFDNNVLQLYIPHTTTEIMLYSLLFNIYIHLKNQ
jgi:hypothetical protein